MVERSVLPRFRGGARPSFHDRDAAFALLGPTRSTASRAYIALMDGVDTPDYERLKGIGRVVKGDEEFALDRIARRERFEPALRGLSEDRVLAAVANVTGISVETLRSRTRGGPIADARCLAGYVGKKLGRIPLGRMARHLGREESYLLKPVSVLEQALDRDQRSEETIDAVIRALRSGNQDFWTDPILVRQMHVVVHQAIGEQMECKALAVERQPFQVPNPIGVVPKHVLALVATNDDVVKTPRNLDPDRTRHPLNNTKSQD